ncbi:MAG TPA: FecR domain-containing protein [Opitutaceae bacterium]|jgi:transmembrane sensor
MSPVPFPSPAAEEQAALWAARLEASRLSPHDREQFESWLQSDPEHARLLQQFQSLSAALDEQLPVLAEVGAVASPTPPVARRPAKIRLFLGLAGAAAAAAAAAIPLAVYEWPVHENYTTSAGERHTLDLADGSRVELNANSELRVTESHSERRARLAHGEAYFVVAKDADRPFVVETPGGTVRVTGTVFNVSDQIPGQLDVTVVEGSVQVRSAGSAGEVYSLKPDDHFSAAASGVQRLSASALDDLLAWRQGNVIFDGTTTLADALATFSRYNGRPVSADPAVADLSVNGSWKLDRFDDFLAELPVRWPVQVNQGEHGAIRVTARSR